MTHDLKNPFKTPNNTMMIFLILLLSLLGFLSMDIYFPSLPAIANHFVITQGESQSTITFYLCGFGFSQLFYGLLSDYFGRRPILLIGFFIYFIGSLLLCLSESIALLFLSRLIQGIGAGASASLCRIILRDKFVGNKMAQVSSYITIGIAIATATAPAIGGFIQDHFDYKGNFFAMLITGIFIALLILLFLPETHHETFDHNAHPKYAIKTYKALLKNITFIQYTLCSGLSLAALLIYAIINPFLLERKLHMSASHYGLITLCIATGELLGTYLNGKYVIHMGRGIMLRIGIIILLLSGFIFMMEHWVGVFNPWSVSLPSFLIAFSIGITLPNASASAFSCIKGSIGAAGAMYGFFQITTTILITYWITKFNTQSQYTLGIFITFIALLSALLISKRSLKEEKNETCS